MKKECMNKTKNGSLISYLQSIHRDVYTSYKEDKSRNKDIYEKNNETIPLFSLQNQAERKQYVKRYSSSNVKMPAEKKRRIRIFSFAISTTLPLEFNFSKALNFIKFHFSGIKLYLLFIFEQLVLLQYL